MSKFERAVDAAIAEENRRFLSDPVTMAEAQAEGEEYRRRLEDEGILPKVNGCICQICSERGAECTLVAEGEDECHACRWGQHVGDGRRFLERLP